MKAASLVDLLAGWPVIVEESWEASPLIALHPDEAAQIADAAPQRRREFAQGRACARRALARLEISGFGLLNGDDRAPCWPAGLLGSITHTARAGLAYAGVAVGRSTAVVTVGIDAEAAQGLDVALHAHVLTPDERGWLAVHPSELQPLLAKIIFSAKEAFYKAQFPLNARRLSFHDVTVTVDIDRSTFDARLTDRVPAAADLLLTHCTGKYVTDAKLLLAGIVVPRAVLPAPG